MSIIIGGGITIGGGINIGTTGGSSGTVYSSANGDWTAGATAAGGGVSWGGGYDKELDYSNTISARALAAFGSVTVGSRLVITVSGVDYTVTVTAGTGNNGLISWLFVDTSNPSGYSGSDKVSAVRFI